MKNKRFIFFVSPRFQLMMMCFSFFLVAAVFSFYYFLQNFYFIEAHRVVHLLDIENKQNFMTDLNMLESARDKFLILVFFVLSVVSILYMLFLSHKIAGPINKTIQWLKSAKFGDTITFRKGDYFQDLSEEINKFSDSKKKTQV